MMHLLLSFLFVGVLCAVCEFILDKTKLTPGHITSFLVFLGCFLEFNHFYDWLFSKVGAGVIVPITSFGHLLTHSAITKATSYLDIYSNMMVMVSAGITVAIFTSFVCTIFFKARD